MLRHPSRKLRASAKSGWFEPINVVRREPWIFWIMSFLYILIYLLTVGGACFGGWKAALYWNNRTRDARTEDMRDQEIRELSAALNVARKNVAKLDNRSGSSAQELALLQEQANKTAAELADCQQKIVVAEAAVNREIETREVLDTRIAQMHRELDAAKSRVAELEVQVKIVSPSSGLVAGLDDLFEDDEKEVFTIRHEHKVFKLQVAELEQAMVVEKAESARWKQHCNVMSKTNKALRQRTDELTQQLSILDDLKAKAAQLIVATADNETLRKDNSLLQKVAAENPQLKIRIAELAGVQDENRLLQQQVEKLSDVHENNLRLTQQLADFAAVQLQLLEAQKENQNLNAQLAEIVTLQEENAGLHARIEALAAIEGENGNLRNDIRTLHSKHTDELNGLRLDNEKLQVRIAALDRIQEENEQLLQQLRELRHVQTQVQELQTQLAEAELRSATQLRQQLAEWHAERAQSTEQLLALEESAAQLLVAQTEAARLQAAETAQLRLVIDRIQIEGNDLCQTIKLLEADKERTSEQLIKAHELLASSSAQATELRVAHDALCDKLVKLENSQLEHDALLTLASDELNAEKAVNSQLRQELAQRNVEAILDSHAQESEVAEAPIANEKAVECAEYENADTDSLPALKVPELQDDLKTIRGVGAKLEQKLNMIGICNFRDLVELEEQGYERAARLIPDLANRIQRDGWMQQARELHRHKYNEAI